MRTLYTPRDVDPQLLRLGAIFLLGFTASFVGTTTGGIGLIVVPVLIFLGLPPHAAIGTSRFAIFAGDIVSLDRLHRAGKTDRTILVPVLLWSFLGALIGSVLLLATPGPLAERTLGVFILLTLAFSLWKRDLGLRPVHVSSPMLRALGHASILALSILSAYFSAATGLLGRTALMTCFGQTYLQSAATRKVQSIAIGIISLLLFAWNGIVDPVASLALVPAMLLGSYLGSTYALRRGERWVRGLFFAVVILSALQLLL